MIVIHVSWWMLAIGIACIMMLSWMNFEPSIRKTARGWVLWYTDVKNRRRYFIIKKSK